MTKKIDINSREFMEQMQRLMAEASESPEGMRALAAAIAPPIEQEIKRREITSLLLTQHNLPVGEPAKYQKRPELSAYWVSKDGDAVESGIKEEEVEFPINRIHSMPVVDISVLKHGNVGSMVDIQKAAATEIRKAIDGRTVNVLSAACLDAQTVTCAGGELTSDALNEAISFIEDKELRVKYILMRGSRMNDMRSWNLDPETRREMMQKGIFKLYNGSEIINSAAASLSEVILVADEEVGKYAVRQRLTTDNIEAKARFKTGWLAWMEVAQGITRPDLLAKVNITA